MSERSVDRTVPVFGGKEEWDEILYVRKWLTSMGVPFEHFESLKMELTQQLRRPPTAGDVIFTILQQWVEACKSTGDLDQLTNAYYQMAQFLHEEGGDFFPAMKESRRAGLMGAKERGLSTKVEIRATSRHDLSTEGRVLLSCPACSQWDGRVLTIDQALDQMPLPNRQCTHEAVGDAPGWCRCMYL